MLIFATTCKNRVSHLERTLPRNLSDNPSARFVVLDYGGTDDLSRFSSSRVSVYRYPYPGPFRMAHAKNMAHRLGILEGASILVNLDADNFTGSGLADFLSTRVHARTFYGPGVLKGRGRKLRGCGGRIAVTPQQFLNAGGYDEKYETWASDDKDFSLRLTRIGYNGQEIPLCYLESIPHGDGVRFAEYPHLQASAGSDELNIVESSTTVVNFGRIGCGEVTAQGSPIDLRPIPTRIFGIGLHRTGTNSLTTALRILGFDSTHWESPRRARRVWKEMKYTGRSAAIESHYAWSDLPIPLLYRQLDAAYSGSKFILTLRDETSWLQSVRNHWSYDRNPWRHTWDSDCFTHWVHEELYGQREFDAEVFRARYRRHTQEVMEYFRGRSDDLLVMHDPSWPDLCRFLGTAIPPSPYPHEYKTRDVK